MSTEAPQADDLVEVTIRRLPLGVYARASEHNDDLLREFALIKDQEGSHGVPARLLALIDQLTAHYSAFTSEPTVALETALERGDRHIDLVYRVPPQARQACLELGDLLEEADRFCRSGGQLLTLTTPEPAVVFRRWFLGEFVRQLDGLPPTPYPEGSGQRQG